MKKLLLALIILNTSAAVSAGSPMIELRIDVESTQDLERLKKIVSIDNFDGRTASVVVVPERLDDLADAGFVFERVTPQTTVTATMCAPGWEEEDSPSWSCYPTYRQYTTFLERLAADHPEICRLVDLGPSTNLVRPHRLFALKITAAPDAEEAEPEVFLTSTMHGDETTGFVLLLRLAFRLLEDYSFDPLTQELVDSTEIWINPLANPDGTYYGGDNTVSGAIRNYTTETGEYSDVNPNRNFPDPRAGQHPQGDPWWPETEAMMAFATEQSITLSANLHGGAEVINYPWDTWCDRHPDDAWWFELSWNWANSAQHDGPSGYMDDCFFPICTSEPCTPGVTHGADWYSVTGSRQDFMTYFHGGREVTAEVSATKLLAADQLDSHWQANRTALMEFIEAAHEGIHGIVTDRSGNPLSATIRIPGHDTDEARSAVRTDPDAGDFHRLLLPGTYDLEVSAIRHDPVVLTDIVVPESGPYPNLRVELKGPPDHADRLVGIADQ